MSELNYGSKKLKQHAGATPTGVSKIAIWISGTLGFVLISSVVGLMLQLNRDVAAIQQQVSAVDKIEHLIQVVTRLEEHQKDIDANIHNQVETISESGTAFAQLSSAQTQWAEDSETIIRLELKDAAHNIKYDPRRSPTDIPISIGGAYLVVAAPQVMRAADGVSECFDLYMRLNDRPIENSNVRLCLPVGDSKSTDVVISQGVSCLVEGDVLSVAMTGFGTGIVAIKPPNEPLIPAIIFSILRVGSC
jgi:hypothetical protein